MVETRLVLKEEVRISTDPGNAAGAGASGLPNDAFRERTIEVTATGEEPVVAKEACVVGEVAIKKRDAERTETVRDTERKTEIEVEDDRTGHAAAIPPKP